MNTSPLNAPPTTAGRLSPRPNFGPDVVDQLRARNLVALFEVVWAYNPHLPSMFEVMNRLATVGLLGHADWQRAFDEARATSPELTFETWMEFYIASSGGLS